MRARVNFGETVWPETHVVFFLALGQNGEVTYPAW